MGGQEAERIAKYPEVIKKRLNLNETVRKEVREHEESKEDLRQQIDRLLIHANVREDILTRETKDYASFSQSLADANLKLGGLMKKRIILIK